MRIVWEKRSCAARDICAVASELHEWSTSTVKTLLGRLVDKGFLKTTQIGNSFLYEPARPAIDSLQSAADELLGNALDETTGPLLSYMVKKSSLSAKYVEELRSILDNYKEEES